MLRCSAAHEGVQLGQVPSEKCSEWLQTELEKGHAACFLLKLVQKTKKQEEKKDTVYYFCTFLPVHEHPLFEISNHITEAKFIIFVYYKLYNIGII